MDSGARSDASCRSVSDRLAVPPSEYTPVEGRCLALIEPEPLAPQAGVPPVTDHEVVEYLDIEESSCLYQFARHRDIVARWGGIARRVIVDDDERGGVLADRFLEDLRHTDLRGVDRAAIDGDDPQA